MLRVLAEDGPLSTGEIVERLTPELTIVAVRERLYLLMGLDNRIDSRDRQVIDREASTGEWGLPAQIADSARGRIPDDVQTLIQRVEDERVRRALERGCDRDLVAEVFDIHERTTWIKERRARAYEFQLDAFSKDGGRPPLDVDCGEATGPGPAGEE